MKCSGVELLVRTVMQWEEGATVGWVSVAIFGDLRVELVGHLVEPGCLIRL